MFPYLRLGPFILPMASLVFLAGLWLGLPLIEREAARLKINASMLSNIIFYSLLAGLVEPTGTREFPNIFGETPPAGADSNHAFAIHGISVSLITFVIFIQRKGLPLRQPSTPSLGWHCSWFRGIRTSERGAFGAPTNVPAIRLWNEYRIHRSFTRHSCADNPSRDSRTVSKAGGRGTEFSVDDCSFLCLQGFPRIFSRRQHLLAWGLSRGAGDRARHYDDQFLLDKKVDECAFHRKYKTT